MSDPSIERATLANGLRVVLAPDHRMPRVGVSVHYGVGFRSEEPGREGFAHLFEHLMFRGSASLPNGRFYEHLVRFVGEANGTTRQDYTEYFQKVPPEALELALFSEADRMRAPRFTAESLREQVQGVAAEIQSVVDGRVLGGFPWPALPAVAYDRWANAHDGYGRAEALLGVTVEDCTDFFLRHYTPGNAVLTITGGFDRDLAWRWVERHLAGLAARAHEPGPRLQEPDWLVDRWAYGTEPGVGKAAVAVAQRLPDPQRDLDGYLTHVVLAEVLGRSGTVAGRRAEVDTTCGFFEPLDARDPDTFITVARVPAGSTAQQTADELREALAGLGTTAGWPEQVAAAVQRSVLKHRRRYADPLHHARALGRLEILFGQAPLLSRLPERLEAVSGGVAEAARRMSRATRAILVLEPGPSRSRAAPPVPPQTATGPSPSYRGPQAIAVEAKPLPLVVPGPPVDRFRPELTDVTVPGGLRAVIASDDRVPLVEVRLRVPLGPRVWACPGRDEQLVREVRRVAAQQGGPPSGTCWEWTTNGDSLLLSGAARPEGLASWLVRAERVLTAPSSRGWAELPAAGPPQEPFALLDAVLRAAAFVGSDPPPDQAVEHLLPRGSLLVVVGPVAGADAAQCARDALAPWLARAQPAAAPRWPGDARMVLPTGRGGSHLLLWAPERAEVASPAARRMATALLGPAPDSLLARAAGRKDREGYLVDATHALVLGQPCFVVRAALLGSSVDDVAADIVETVRRAAEGPPDDEQVSALVEFCGAQVAKAFDAPQSLADALVDVVTDASGPEAFCDGASLAAVTGADIQQALATGFRASDLRMLALRGRE